MREKLELYSVKMLQESPPVEMPSSYSSSPVVPPPLAATCPGPAVKISPSAAECRSELEEFRSLLLLCNVASDS